MPLDAGYLGEVIIFYREIYCRDCRWDLELRLYRFGLTKCAWQHINRSYEWGVASRERESDQLFEAILNIWDRDFSSVLHIVFLLLGSCLSTVLRYLKSGYCNLLLLLQEIALVPSHFKTSYFHVFFAFMDIYLRHVTVVNFPIFLEYS